jgi:Family of unknown function (DUF6350)
MGTVTDLLSRPDHDRPGARDGGTDRVPGPRPVILSAVIGAGACLLAGVLACAAVAVVGWLAASLGGATGAVRAGAVVWLLAHKSGVTVGSDTVTLAPLGLSLAVAAGLYRAGRFTARVSAADRTGELVTAAITLTVGYGGGAALVAVLASSGGATVSPLSALLGAGLLAALAGTAGVLVESGAAEDLADTLPDWFRDAVPGAVAAALATVAAGTALFLVSLIAHWGRVGTLVGALDPGPVGGAVLFALCLVLLPNAALLAVAFLAGPGFQVGAGTTVAPTGVELGNLPAFPLLAALPTDGATPSYLLVLTAVVPLLAGAAGGVVVARRTAAAPVGEGGWEVYAGRAALAGVLAGLGLLALMNLAGGSAGPGRMAEIGVPSSLAAAGVLTAGLALGGVAAALLARLQALRGAR